MALIYDELGNAIGFRADGLYLRLATEKKKKLRQLFKIKDGKVSKWVHPNNVLKKARSVGFNYEGCKAMVNKGHKDLSVIIGSQPAFHITFHELLDKGDFLWFKKDGFDKQIFWKIPDWVNV